MGVRSSRSKEGCKASCSCRRNGRHPGYNDRSSRGSSRTESQKAPQDCQEIRAEGVLSFLCWRVLLRQRLIKSSQGGEPSQSDLRNPGWVSDFPIRNLQWNDFLGITQLSFQ